MEQKNETKLTIFQKLKDKLDKKLKEAKKDPYKLVLKYVIFFAIITTLILIDQLTKTFIFKWNSSRTGGAWESGDRTDITNLVIIGFRSVGHRGVTVLPWKDNLAVITIVQTFSILIGLGLLFVPFFATKKTIIVFSAFIFAGNFGNMLDRFLFEGGMVKDILFVPFLEKWLNKSLGTFNFADVFILFGAISISIYFIVYEVFFKNSELREKKKEKKKDNKEKVKNEN